MAYKERNLLALTVFSAIRVQAGVLPSPWVSVGCYTDNPSSLTLKNATTTDAANMTIEACIEFCTPNGYTFAGVEDFDQCFCDNNIQATGVPAATGCNRPCPGDSTEICGGADRINIYKRTIPAGWESVGCFTDQSSPPSPHTLKAAEITDVAGMTIEECASFCTARMFQLAGVELGHDCYCDNIIESTGVPATNGCNLTCTGDANEICGGVNHINIYNHTALTHPIPVPPVPTIRQIVGTYQYEGCFLDLVNGSANALAHRKIIPGGTTLELCTSYCKAAGFPVAGVELGRECWCDSYMGLAARAPDSDCSSACEGPDISESCGGLNRLAVYTDSSSTPPPLDTCLANVISLICTINSFRFDLQAVPVAGGAPSTLGIMSLGSPPNRPAIYPLISSTNFLPVNRSIDAVTFNFLNSTFFPDAVGTNGVPVAQNITAGSEQSFIAMSNQTFSAFRQYCVMPNPNKTFGPFIGPPTIAINGRNDLWFLCSGPNLSSPTIFFQPVVMAGVTCENVYLSMIYPSVGSSCNGC